MTLPQEGCLLRIFIGESDKHAGKPLYEWIVTKAGEVIGRCGPGMDALPCAPSIS